MTLDKTSISKAEAWRPIIADDAAIEAALAEAHIPSLVNALVHLTGDLSLLSGDIKPDNALFGDPQAGITPAQQQRVRAMALDALRAYRDGGCAPSPVPTDGAIHQMMNFLIGEELPEAYIEFLVSELSLRGEDPYGQPGLDSLPAASKRDFFVVVIGAGMSGLLSAIRLQEAGIAHVVIEKNPEVGGTWFENTYPGCRVDSPNHTYSYSFRPNDWPQHFSEQKVLLDYFQRTADEFGLRQRVRFQTTVEAAAFDEARGRWSVTLTRADGATEVLEANAIIAAVGQLNRPKFPDIPNQDQFQGPSFHSAEWRHDVDLTGKRVAVVGTGASAFQFVPEIAKSAAQVTIFQRTPPWISPTPEYHEAIPEGKHWLLNHVPYYAKWFRFWMFWRTAEGLLGAVKKDPAWNDQQRAISAENDGLRMMLTEYIKQLVGDDEELLSKTIPDYPAGGKRMLRDNGNWIRALQRDNVEVLTDPIVRVTAAGLACASGVEHAFDVIVYGTGFHADRFLSPMKITGRGGVDLQSRWQGDARAYLGIAIPGFPNLFCLYGPNTNIVVNGSIIFFSECEVRYVMGCLQLLMERGSAAIDCRKEVHDEYNAIIDAGNAQMAWGVPNVRSWYKNDTGRVSQNWPFTLLEFWIRTRQPDPADYEFL